MVKFFYLPVHIQYRIHILQLLQGTGNFKEIWLMCIVSENNYQLECESQLLNFLTWNVHNIWQLSFQPLIPVLKPVSIYFNSTLT